MHGSKAVGLVADDVIHRHISANKFAYHCLCSSSAAAVAVAVLLVLVN